jgi:phosphoribosylanthranilate isomerase
MTGPLRYGIFGEDNNRSGVKMAFRTRIKVCGITCQEDARAAVAAGADALGFIFVEQSPRLVEPDMVRSITGELPPFIDRVGVFRNEEIEVVEEIIHYCRLSLVQLHGSELPEYCGKITCKVLKSFCLRPESDHEELAAYADTVSGFLLDTYHEDLAGGTGMVFDWNLVAHVKPPGPVILAGGLNPENVGEAIRQVKPFAVDVNSGVEYQPGRKDTDKLKSFVQEVRKADEQAGKAGTPFLA